MREVAAQFEFEWVSMVPWGGGIQFQQTSFRQFEKALALVESFRGVAPEEGPLPLALALTHLVIRDSGLDDEPLQQYFC